MSTRKRKKPTTAVNHRESSPETPTPTTATTSKSPQTNNKVFTENDEIKLLNTLLESSKSTPNSVTSPPPLSDLFNGSFTETQISNKVKTLKERYHKLAKTKSQIKTPQDRKIYENGRKIWGRKTKANQPWRKSHEITTTVVEQENPVEEQVDLGDFPVPVNEMSKIQENPVEEQVDLVDFPVLTNGMTQNQENPVEEQVDLGKFSVLVSEMTRVVPGNEFCKEGLKRLGAEKLKGMNEKWKELRVEEGELMIKKVGLFQEQLKLVMEGMKASTSNN